MKMSILNEKRCKKPIYYSLNSFNSKENNINKSYKPYSNTRSY